MKKVLIATDFSPHAQYTVEYVLDFLQDTKASCEVYLLNTYMVLQNDADRVISVNDQLKKQSQIGLQQAEKAAQKLIKNPLIKISSISRMGSLKNVISQLLKKEKFDFVAMGKNGGKNVESISEVLKEKHCPLLLTYLDHKHGQIHN